MSRIFFNSHINLTTEWCLGEEKKKKNEQKLIYRNWVCKTDFSNRLCSSVDVNKKKIIFCDSDLAMKRKMASKKAISMTQINSIASSNGFQIVYGISAR